MVYEEYSGVGKQYVRGFAGNNRSRTSIKPLRHSTGSFFASIMVESTGYIPRVFFIFSLLFPLYPRIRLNCGQWRAFLRRRTRERLRDDRIVVQDWRRLDGSNPRWRINARDWICGWIRFGGNLMYIVLEKFPKGCGKCLVIVWNDSRSLLVSTIDFFFQLAVFFLHKENIGRVAVRLNFNFSIYYHSKCRIFFL